MRITAELRWFNLGPLPQAIAAWFAHPKLGQYQQPPTHREDNYLYLPNQDHVGIKTRQGQLEIKLRQAQLEKLPLGVCGWGWAEQWIKWRGENQSEEKLPDPVSEGIWLKVEKTRSQRQYQLLPSQTLKSKTILNKPSIEKYKDRLPCIWWNKYAPMLL